MNNTKVSHTAHGVRTDQQLLACLRAEYPSASEQEIEQHYLHYVHIVELLLEIAEDDGEPL